MSEYTRMSLAVKDSLIAIRGGTLDAVYDHMRRTRIDCPNKKTVHRHLMSLYCLGIVELDAKLIDHQARKVWKVRECLCGTGRV